MLFSTPWPISASRRKPFRESSPYSTFFWRQPTKYTTFHLFVITHVKLSTAVQTIFQRNCASTTQKKFLLSITQISDFWCIDKANKMAQHFEKASWRCLLLTCLTFWIPSAGKCQRQGFWLLATSCSLKCFFFNF